MLTAFGRAFRTPDLRNKMLFTLAILALSCAVAALVPELLVAPVAAAAIVYLLANPTAWIGWFLALGLLLPPLPLFERLEAKLEQYPGQLTRACVELAKDWRTDRYLRRLEAMMLVADKSTSLVLTGTGDVLEPEHGVMGIGSGGNYALAAARALLETDLDAETIARKAMAIAADICVYTNEHITLESLSSDA